MIQLYEIDFIFSSCNVSSIQISAKRSNSPTEDPSYSLQPSGCWDTRSFPSGSPGSWLLREILRAQGQFSLLKSLLLAEVEIAKLGGADFHGTMQFLKEVTKEGLFPCTMLCADSSQLCKGFLQCFLIVSVWLSPTRQAGFGAELEESHTEVCQAATKQPCPLPGVPSCTVLGQRAARQQLGMGVLYQSHREGRAAGSTHAVLVTWEKCPSNTA